MTDVEAVSGGGATSAYDMDETEDEETMPVTALKSQGGPVEYFKRRFAALTLFGANGDMLDDTAVPSRDETRGVSTARTTLDMPLPLEAARSSYSSRGAAAYGATLPSRTERFQALVRQERALAASAMAKSLSTSSKSLAEPSLTDEVNAIYDAYDASAGEAGSGDGDEALSSDLADGDLKARERARIFATAARRKYMTFAADVDAGDMVDHADALGLGLVDRIKQKVAKASNAINKAIQRSATTEAAKNKKNRKAQKRKQTVTEEEEEEEGEEGDESQKMAAAATRSLALRPLPPVVPLGLRATTAKTKLAARPLASRPLPPLRAMTPAKNQMAAVPPFLSMRQLAARGTSSSLPPPAATPAAGTVLTLTPEHEALVRTVRDMALDGPVNVAADVRPLFTAAAAAMAPDAVCDANLVLASALGTVRERAERTFQTPLHDVVRMHRSGRDGNVPSAPLTQDAAKRTADRLCALVRSERDRAQPAPTSDDADETRTVSALTRGTALGEAILQALGPAPAMRTMALAAAALTDLVTLTQNRATGDKYPDDTAKRIEAFWSQPMTKAPMLHARAHFE